MDREVLKGASGNGFSSLLIYPAKRSVEVDSPLFHTYRSLGPQEVEVGSQVKMPGLNTQRKKEE